MAFSGATNWIANFTVTVEFLPLFKAVGLTGCLRFLCDSRSDLPAFRMVFTVRETKDKTLEQMKDTTELNSFLGVGDQP